MLAHIGTCVVTDTHPFSWQQLCKQHAKKNNDVPSPQGAPPINTHHLHNTDCCSVARIISTCAEARGSTANKRPTDCPTLQQNMASLPQAANAQTLCLPTRDGEPLPLTIGSSCTTKQGTLHDQSRKGTGSCPLGPLGSGPRNTSPAWLFQRCPCWAWTMHRKQHHQTSPGCLDVPISAFPDRQGNLVAAATAASMEATPLT